MGVAHCLVESWACVHFPHSYMAQFKPAQCSVFIWCFSKIKFCMCKCKMHYAEIVQ